MPSIKRYPVQRVINWYYGNFCTRNCFNKEKRLMDCYKKFELFKSKNKDLMITHKEFKDLLDGGILKSAGLIQTLEERRLVGNSLKDG